MRDLLTLLRQRARYGPIYKASGYMLYRNRRWFADEKHWYLWTSKRLPYRFDYAHDGSSNDEEFHAISDWIKDHTSDFVWVNYDTFFGDGRFFFGSRNDAFAFRMRWGGPRIKMREMVERPVAQYFWRWFDKLV
jgi:hypothetical protein